MSLLAFPRLCHAAIRDDRTYNDPMPAKEPNAWIPHPLRRLGGLALTLALNRLVALDPDTREAIDRLEGRRIGVHLRGPEIAFSIAARGGTLQIEPPPNAGDDGSANDFEVNATPGSLLALAREELGGGPGEGPREGRLLEDARRVLKAALAERLEGKELVTRRVARAVVSRGGSRTPH